MNAKEKLTCKYCGNIYKNPITLACGDSICKHHIDELVSNDASNKFACPLCDEENVKQNFKENKLMQDLLESDFHKLDVNSKFKNILDNLKTEIHNLEDVLNDPDSFIYKEISELKRKVDLDRENLKSEIDRLSNGLIQQLESFDNRFKTEYKTNVDFGHYNTLIELSRKQLEEFENCLNLFSSRYKEKMKKSKQSEKVIKILQPEIAELKKQLFSNLSLSYEPFKENMEDLYGQIIIKVSKKFNFLIKKPKLVFLFKDKIIKKEYEGFSSKVLISFTFILD